MNTQRNLNKTSLAVILLILAIVSGPSSGEPVLLIKILKGDPSRMAVLERLQIQVVQELRTCYLARADREDLRLLRRNGIRSSVLDSSLARKEHFLIPSTSLQRLTGLAVPLHLIEIESGTLLGWTQDVDPTAVIPPDVPRVPLLKTAIIASFRHPSLITAAAPERRQAPSDGIIQLIVDQVSPDNLRSLVRNLELFQTRYASTTQCEAAGDYIYLYFQSLGLDVSYEPFTYQTSLTTRNIVAEIRGQADPDEVVLIGAHYDSTSTTPTTLAPGADDNASGTAAVMEAARVLAPYTFDFTVRFIAFSAEESGLYGSRYHASLARARGERIIGVINPDMIAYADAMPEELEIIVNRSSAWMAERIGLAATAYTGLPVLSMIDPSIIYSDHSPFWGTGYSAALLIEDMPLHNPYYHQTTDTSDILNFEFFGGSAKIAIGALSELAQPVRSGYPQTPSGLDEATSHYSSLFDALTVVTLTWESVPGAAGYNVYRTTTPHLDYQKINASPVETTSFADRIPNADTSYYYVVTAVNAGGLESNYSREVGIVPPLVSPSRTISLLFPALIRRGIK